MDNQQQKTFGLSMSENSGNNLLMDLNFSISCVIILSYLLLLQEETIARFPCPQFK